MFFFLLLFVLCSRIVYIYQDCCSSLYTAMTCHSGDSFDYEDSYLNIKNQHHPSFLLSSLLCLHLSPFLHASANCTCLPPDYLSLTLDAQYIPNLSAPNLFHSQPFQIIRPSKPGSRGSHTNTTILLHSKSLSLVEIKPRTAALHEPLCHRGGMTRHQALWKQMIQGVETHELSKKSLTYTNTYVIDEVQKKNVYT